ncbi:TPA: hypothetical protein DDW69_00820 [candidate division CPR2 bacterium]|uniref:Dockerin domain-containing protein n=1 Tax=candidate division CPR2 bacterium GW2011_GWC1_41_48 TaxID=1618344 RepID=A0A0G0WA00_UNCC2|nr:MAG: hypothetical protein UT47_C0004G0031 [candidate division CPR2 bacterium GW2011_GWC2_39_35]KKR28085.1 MAG: hypothetical protein UT60_C0028G0020 [candidate division CPR2 bacterium GW2011_GWD2_39_7]KKS08877.1 MAG: hypothetical protein UU65_C0004G0088 [candidate division CPR2 bacterium GW2011_GWC1_41_48]OGB72179.1 MAG: hypothetical protein A2Y26_00700 [candidate division CPR2 bacterium GWD2_39_7]HBG81362.1 hypothetical protein [candidate division CPR2 bacterium]
MIKKSLKVLIPILFAVTFISFSPEKASAAINPLYNPRDVINNGDVGAWASHQIKFGISMASEPLIASDWIFIELPYFTQITEPTYASGFGGVPQYSVIDKQVRITGITANPGAYFTFYGLTAFNPVSPDQFDVYIRISKDVDGFDLREEAHIYATTTDGSVVVSAMIEAQVGTLRIMGVTSPGMFITFLEDGGIIGTCTAGNGGAFSQVFPGLNPVQHTIEIVGADPLERSIPPTTIEVFTRAYEITTVSGLILPPSISLDNSEVIRGAPLIISGMGVPDYQINIYVDPGTTYTAIPDVDGNWSYTIADTSDFEFGIYTVNALNQDPFGSTSLFSVSITFVIKPETPPEPGPGCDITRGDLNCDNAVNLIDFSILLFYWGSGDVNADINKDKNVNLVDFSIMMFYWQS